MKTSAPLVVFLATALPALAQPTADAIREEALRPNFGSGRPLPLAAHWNTGTQHAQGFHPSYQLQRIDEGHFLLPWIQMPNLEANPADPYWIGYYEAAVRRAAQLHLPLTLVGTQWEMLLYLEGRYTSLPPDDNPNVVNAGGQVQAQVSPFGPTRFWSEVGRRWTESPMMRKLQEWYPDPPLVIFVSNNEAAKLQWKSVEDDFRFRQTYPNGGDDAFKRQVMADGWIARYRALQQGMRDGLVSGPWKTGARFVGYDAFGPRHFARWWGWEEFGLPTAGRIDPAPLTWDGGSPSFYIYNWQALSAEYKIFGPEIEAMNWVFMLKEAHRFNPDFWFELSSWDGHEPENFEGDKRKEFARWGQSLSPERYLGMLQFGMWLLRPRAVRDFRGYRDTLLDSEAYFVPVMDAVDRVHRDPTLRHFWREGELVPNRSRQHLYQSGLFGYQAEDRWFLLNTSLEPAPGSWQLLTEFPVLALALVNGGAPARQWLVYAHSPLAHRPSVRIDLPEYGSLTVPAAVGGSFYVVDEASRTVQPVNVPTPPGRLVFTQAASYGPISPGSHAIAWGTGLAAVDRITLDVSPRPGSGEERSFNCALGFAGESQLNFVLPAIDVPPGHGGRIRAWRGGQIVASGWITLSSARPGLFTANASGQGVAAAYVIHRDGQGHDSTELVYEAGPGGYVPKPIVKRQSQLFLVLYATGAQPRPYSTSTATYCFATGARRVLVDGVEAPLLFWGEAPGFPGVDQMNVDLTGMIGGLARGRDLPVSLVLGDCFGPEIPSNGATIRIGN